MFSSAYSNRLVLTPLSFGEEAFVLELLNSPGWIKNIGNRNIQNEIDARSYIQKIVQTENISYWLVQLKESKKSIGLVTLIKRNYLDHSDIGFAFLPQYSKQGYAYEATLTALIEILKETKHQKILATTIEENTDSIRLLKKIGLKFSHEIIQDGEKLLLFEIDAEKLAINSITKTFYSIFSNKYCTPDLNFIYALCTPQCTISQKINGREAQLGLTSFIEPRKEILSNGSLNDFEEIEIAEETNCTGNKALRKSNYLKSGKRGDVLFKTSGFKEFQFIRTAYGWKISSIYWEENS